MNSPNHLSDTLRIATRKSPLALWQAEYVKNRLESLYPALSVELVTMTSQGDVLLDTPLAKIGGKGLFVKELELALLEGRADIAVHSMKDVPMDFPEGLGLAVICEREDPTDAFVSNHFKSLDDMPPGSRLGTSSLRRQSQLLARYPHLEVLFLRGNVNTRLAKLDAGDYDAIILASAGLRRLGMADRITQSLSTELSLPAGGQGAVGIETRLADTRILEILSPLNHPETAERVTAERSMNRFLEGGCQVPIACFADYTDKGLRLRGLVGSVDGATILRAESCEPDLTPEALGIEVAKKLLQQGAGDILQDIYKADG